MNISIHNDTYTELRVVVDDINPYISVEKVNNSLTISGYMRELWSIMEQTLHIKSKFIKSPFMKGKNLLISGSIDVVLIPVVVTTSDVDEFDYSIPVAKTWYELYTKRNGDSATSVSYIETWSPNLWLAFLLTICLLSLILWIMLKIRQKYNLDYICNKREPEKFLSQWKHLIENDEKHETLLGIELLTLESCFLIVLGTLTNQGFNVDTKSTSLRFIMLVILFFGLLMLNSYSAVLVSRLAVDKVDILFPTLESVIDRGKYVLCVRESSYAYRIFKKNESDTDVMPNWRSVVNQPPCRNITTTMEITNALCEDHTVILESPDVISSILGSKKCTISRMPGRYATAYTSLLMRKHFKFHKKINELLQKLLNSGTIDYLQKKWLRKRIPQVVNISSNKPVTINHINGVLVVYALTILLSLTLLATENFIHWKKNKKIRIKFTN